MLYTSEFENSTLSAVLCRWGEQNYKVGESESQFGVFHAMIHGWVTEEESFSDAFVRVTEESIGSDIVLREETNSVGGNVKYVLLSKGIVSEVFEIPGGPYERRFISVIPWQQFLKLRPDVSSAGIKLVQQRDEFICARGRADPLEETTINRDGIDLMRRGFEYFAQQGVVY